MVIWTDNAISNITAFIDNSYEDSEKSTKNYMNKLVDYVDILNTMPELGKSIDFIVPKYEVKQLIYRVHRILYHKKRNDIVVLAVLHTKLDLVTALKKIKKDLF